MTATTEDPDVVRDQCYRCGYDLRGVADERSCPECGLVALHSRRPSDELQLAHPNWLGKLSWGLRLILVALAVLIIWPMIGDTLERHARAIFWNTRRGALPATLQTQYLLWRHAFWACADVAAMLLLAGIFLLTTPEGLEPADNADRWRRRLLRLSTALPVVAVLLLHLLTQFDIAALSRAPIGSSRGFYFDKWMIVIFLMMTLGLAPLPLLLFFQLRSLAKRCRHPNLAEDCAIVGIGNTATLVYLPIGVLVMENAARWGLGRYWTSRSSVALVLMMIPILASIVFVLWNFYVLIRFARAFAGASKAFRRQWAQNDAKVMAAVRTPAN